MSYDYLLPRLEFKHSPEPCPGCPSPDARRVGGRGRKDAEFVIIGEAPGVEELKFGSPFCGPSGDLLMRVMPEGYNLDQETYVINSLQCRPPKSTPTKEKDYKTRACAACRGRVLSQVFAYPRKVVLALGGWSNISLTNNYSYKITQRRGEPYELKYTDDNGLEYNTVVVPAVHPAFLLRGSGNPRVFQDDVRLALSLAFAHRPDVYTPPTLEGEEEDEDEEGEGEGRQDPKRIWAPVRDKVLWVDPKYEVLDTPLGIRHLANMLCKMAESLPEGEELPVAADIETSGFRFLRDEILCLGIYHPDIGDTAFIIPGEKLKEINVGLYVSSEPPDTVYVDEVRRLLALPRIRYVWQFGKFDEKFLRCNDLVLKDWGIKEDTGLLSYATSEATKDHDLDEQAKNVIGAPDHKWMVKPYAPKKTDSYSQVPKEVLYPYLAKDLKKTLLVWMRTRKEVSEDVDLEKLYTLTLVPGSHLLAQIEEYGITVDWNYVRINKEGATEEDVARGLVPSLWKTDKEGNRVRTEIGLEMEMANLITRLEEMVGYPVNPNSPDEVAELLYDRIGLTIKGKRPQDTRKETLDKLPPNPVVRILRDYRSLSKMKGTYVAALEKYAIDGRIHTSFKMHATTTGRLSSSEPNIQNIPRDPRWKRMYRAGKGMILVEADYNSAELRMLGAVSEDEFLTGIFLDDKRNLHDEVSIAMYGPEFNADQRIRAKAINFGIPYGRKAISVALEFDMSVIEAQRLIDAWLARAPKAAKFLKWCKACPLQGKSLVTVFGRKRRPGVVSQERADGLQNEFSNFPMQSPISDFVLHSGMRMLPRLKREGAHIVNLIHDSILVECPDDSRERIETVGGIMQEVMVQIPTEWIITPIQFKVDLKIGYNWGMGKSPEKFWPTWKPQHQRAA